MERIPVYIMRGLPGSGKSTFAKRLQLILSDIGFNVIYLSRDEIRDQLAKQRGVTYDQTFNDGLNNLVSHRWRIALWNAFDIIKIPRKAIIVDTKFTNETDIIDILDCHCHLKVNNEFSTYEDWITSKQFKVRIVEFPEVPDNNHRNVSDKKMKEFRHEFIVNRSIILSYLSEKNIIYVK